MSICDRDFVRRWFLCALQMSRNHLGKTVRKQNIFWHSLEKSESDRESCGFVGICGEGMYWGVSFQSSDFLSYAFTMWHFPKIFRKCFLKVHSSTDFWREKRRHLRILRAIRFNIYVLQLHTGLEIGWKKVFDTNLKKLFDFRTVFSTASFEEMKRFQEVVVSIHVTTHIILF